MADLLGLAGAPAIRRRLNGSPVGGKQSNYPPGSAMYDDERLEDIGALRRELVSLMDVHPCENWSPALLKGIIRIVQAAILFHGLQPVRDDRRRLRVIR